MNSESHWAAKRPLPFTNVSGETIPAFGVMAITGLVYENGIAFLECDKPGTTFRREYAVNNMFNVPADRRGTGFRAGDVRVLYDQGTPGAGEGWGPKPGQWSLSQGFPGFAALGIVDSVHKIAKAIFEPIAHVLVKTTSFISPNATTQFYRVHAGPFGGEADAGFSSVPPARNRTGQNLDVDEWAWLQWTNNGWELRCMQNRVYHATYLAGLSISPGASGFAILPDGRVVSFKNWSVDATIDTNDKILVWQDFTDGAWYAIRSGRAGARWFNATLGSGGLSSADATGEVTTYEALDGGAHPGLIAAAVNKHRLSGQSGDEVLVVENLAQSNYQIVQVQHVHDEFVTEITYDPATERILKHKKRDVTVMHEAPETAYQNIITAEIYEVVDQVNYDTGTNVLSYNTRFVYTLPNSAAGGNVPIHTMLDVNVVDAIGTDSLGNITIDKQTVTVWESADVADENLAVITTTLLAVVTDVYQAGVNIMQNKHLALVVGTPSGPFASVAVAGEECEESPGQSVMSPASTVHHYPTAALVAATHF